ncbi:MAG TPA: DNA gyrase inhibitor YacG [Polyangiaceae bacterium]|jgi:hypothetical protein
MRIVCPICKTVLEDAPERHGPRPFCSTRCKMIDLGNWLNEAYRVSEPIRPEDAEDELSKLS